jgi:hypothetical protein
MKPSSSRGWATSLTPKFSSSGPSRSAIKAFGPGNTHTALNQNSLGKLYIKMGRVDEAEAVLQATPSLRAKDLDTTVTRENLVQVYEARGDLRAAKEMKNRGLPDKLVCSHQKCGTSSVASLPTRFP